MRLQGSSGDPNRDKAGRIALASICAERLADAWADGARSDFEAPALLVLDLEDALGNLLASTYRLTPATDGRRGTSRIVMHPECPTILTVLLEYGDAKALLGTVRPDLCQGDQRYTPREVPVIVVTMGGATTFVLRVVDGTGDSASAPVKDSR